VDVDVGIAMLELVLGAGEDGPIERFTRGDGDGGSLAAGCEGTELLEAAEELGGVGVVAVVESEMEANAEKVCG
jgi:hypothetical protein